ncbi:uncharacterized protein LOC143286304 [Babylonia areolata]|uniref:uncharacterized protein LOC143286304 n=1 Tax=Babylonia areolata TaxID=304850 RepID=UPI003FD42116
MIQRLCIENPKDWDLFIPAVLFAFREVPQESLRFSPFELLYGCTVRRPIALLHQLWTKEASSPPETLTEVEYVVDLRNRLEETCRLARENLQQAATKYKRQYDKKARERWFEAGDEVLLLLPEKKNKLQIAWQGPYRVIERVGNWDYQSDEKTSETYDGVILCQGFFTVPFIPDTPGLDEGYQGRVSHANSYRDPQPYKGRTVLVVGNPE